MSEKSHKITIGVMGLALGNIAWNRYGRAPQLADKAELLVRWKSVSGIVDHRYQFHCFLPCDQVFVTALGHIVSFRHRHCLATQDSGLRTNYGCSPGRCGITKA